MTFSFYLPFFMLLCYPFGNLFAQSPDIILGQSYLDSAKVNLDSSKYDLALSYGRQTLDIFRDILGEQDTTTANAYELLGSIWMKKGGYQKSIFNYQKALEVNLTVLGETHSKVADAFYGLGIAYNRQGEWDKALEYHRKALEIRRSAFPENHPDIADSFYEIGYAYDFKGDLDNGLTYYKKSLEGYLAAYGENHSRVALACNGVGIIYDFKNDYDQALEYYQKALDILLTAYVGRHLDLLASIYNNIGIIYRIKADYQKALKAHQNALQTRLSIWGEEHGDVAASYGNLASLYHSTGAWRKSLDYYQKALGIRRKVYGENHFRTASSYLGIGDMYFLKGNLDKALVFTEKGIKIKEVHLGEGHFRLAGDYKDLGMIYRDKGELDKASEYYQKALTINRATFGDQHFVTARMYDNFAEISQLKGELEKTLEYLQKALEIRKAIYKENNPELAKSYGNIGITYIKQHKLDEALAFLNQALATGPESTSDIATLYSLIGEVYFMKKEYKTAIEYDDKALEIIEGIRKRYVWAETKAFHISNYYSNFENAIHNIVETVDASPSQFDLEKAFTCAEKAKSNFLLEAVNTSRAESIAGIPDSLLQKEYDLSVEIAFYRKKQFEENQKGANKNDSLLHVYNDKLLYYRQAYESLIQQFERQYPKYYNLKYNTAVASAANLQKTLINDHQALIEYFVGEKAIYVFVITTDAFRVEKINRDFPLEKWVDSLRQGIYAYHFSADKSERLFDQTNALFVENAYRLYDKLIRPLGALPEKIILIPDDVLAYLPFEALLMEKPVENYQFQTHAYLGRAHQISYNFSATLWREMRDKKHTAFGLLAIAPFFPEEDKQFASAANYRREGLGPLLYNKEEALIIHEMLGGKVLTGREATAANFKQMAAAYNILHFATHAKADDEEVDYSFLAFAEEVDSLSYNKIFISDLYNMRLSADMVVLSACETGFGELQRGEGVISLARGFAYAGAKSIVSSLWSANDRSTAEIMKLFYEHLKTGLAKDEALQKAKFAYLDQQKDPLNAHPFYWATFIAAGDMAPIKWKKNFPWSMLLGGLLVAAAGGFFLWRRSQV